MTHFFQTSDPLPSMEWMKTADISNLVRSLVESWQVLPMKDKLSLEGALSGSRYPMKGDRSWTQKMPKSFFSGNFAVYGPIYFKYRQQCSNSGGEGRVCLLCVALQIFLVNLSFLY